MSRTRSPYPPAYRARILEQVRAGRSPEDLAEEYEPTAQTIRNWMKQSDLDAGQRTDGLTTDEKVELRRLRRENARLREEREILEKAAAWFASRSGKLPRKPSDS
jgi:transposase